MALLLIRELGLDPTISRQIHANRLRRLAREGEQYSSQFLARFDAQRRHPFSAHWGDGTTSSSDGQRFPVGGRRSHTAQINGKYGPEPGLVFYTHISDQKVLNLPMEEAFLMADCRGSVLSQDESTDLEKNALPLFS